MVSPAAADVGRRFHPIADGTGSAGPGWSVAPACQPCLLDGLEVERQRLQALKMLEAVIDTFQKARKGSTNATYERIWKAFQHLSFASQLDLLRPSEAHLLDFFQAGLEKGMSYSSLHVRVSIVSSLTP